MHTGFLFLRNVTIHLPAFVYIWVILKKGGIGLFKGTRKYNP